MSTEAARFQADVAAAVSHLSHQEVLRRRGWHGALDQLLVIRALVKFREGLAPADIVNQVRTDALITLDQLRLQRAFRSLLRTGTIEARPGGRYGLSPSARRTVEEEWQAIDDEARLVRARFEDSAARHCPDVPVATLWNAFEKRFLGPLIESFGAKTIEFILGGAVNVAECRFLDEVLPEFAAEHQPAVRDALVDFLDPSDRHVARMVSERLTQRYLLEAAALSPDAVELLDRLLAQRPTFKIFLDTNLLLACLGLQDDFANEVAASLLQLRDELAGRLHIEFLVLPVTLREAMGAIRSAKAELTGDQDPEGEFSSLALVCLRDIKKPGASERTPTAYFDALAASLKARMRKHGIKLHNVDTMWLETEPAFQATLDDFRSRRGMRDGTKEDAKHRHDVTLCLFPETLRPEAASVVDATWWTGTLDRFLVDFNASRLQDYELTVCLHPSTFLQLVSFWVPRNPTLEEALIGAVRQPLAELLDLNPVETSNDILAAIADLESRDDLDDDGILELAVTRAYKAVMQEPEPMAAEADEDAAPKVDLLDANKRLHERNTELQAELATALRRLEELQDRAKAHEERAEALASEIARGRADADADKKALRETVEALRTEKKATERSRHIRRFYRRVLPATVASTTMAAYIGGAAVADRLADPHPLAVYAGVLVTWCYVSLVLLRWFALHDPVVAEHRFWGSNALKVTIKALQRAVVLLIGGVLRVVLSTRGRDDESEDPPRPSP